MILGLEKYIENTRKIRVLSSPSLESLDSPEKYEHVLKSNFENIGILAKENREILEKIRLHTKTATSLPSEEEILDVINLFSSLFEDKEMKNFDIPLCSFISSYLWDNMLDKVSMDLSIMIADLHAVSCRLMVKYSARTYPYSKVCLEYCKKGKKACDYIISFLDYDKWNLIKNIKIKQIILNRAAYKYCFYVDKETNFEHNETRLKILKNAIKIENQDIYKDAFTPDEWIAYKINLRECLGSFLESDNALGFTYSQCYEIKQYMEELMTLWREYPEICMENSSYSLSMFYYYRACYFTGDISGSIYKSKLLDIYKSRSKHKFTDADVILNLLLPVEYVKHMKKRRIMEQEIATLEQFYRNAISYVFQCPNLGSIINILDYLLQLLSYFQEIPGGATFEETGLECLAALHPPTFIHSKMVANISRCLCKHLLREKPELFSKMTGFDDVKEILSYRDNIINYTYHSALCHDFGKIAIMDTVLMYGRNITDLEFDQIKSHPEIGAQMLSKNVSTSQYQNIALGHHRWYNDKGGYPGVINTGDLKEGIIINIVACADCMDAATDKTGRSYNKGLSLGEFIDEIKDQMGTRYAPFIADLLENPEVQKDLEFLLSEVRTGLYRDTFVMLKRVQRLGGYTEIFGSFSETD